MGDPDRIDVDAYANEVFTIARALFAFSNTAGERGVAYELADDADPDRLGDIAGKYIKRGNSYIQILPNGNGRTLRELPADTNPNEVIVDLLDVSEATPLQDRLKEIGQILRGPDEPRALALAEAIDRILTACSPGEAQKLFAAIKERALEVALPQSESEASDLGDRGRRFFGELAELAANLRGQPTGDGETISSLLLISAVALALASARPAGSREETRSLVASAGFLAAPTPVPLPAVAEGLCQRAIKEGDENVVRAVAEELKGRGDDLIQEALNAGLNSFYPPLYAAAGYELAVFHAARAAAEVVADSAARKRWAKLAVNAEENGVRILASLQFAVLNLDGSRGGEHLARIREIRSEQGDEAARIAAQDLILNHLLYPRLALPILLGEEAPPPVPQAA